MWDILVPRETYVRPVTSCREGPCLRETSEVPQALPLALPRLSSSTGLPQGIYKGRISLLTRMSLIYTSLGYSDLRHSGPHCSVFQSALQSLCACTTNSDTDSWSSECSWHTPVDSANLLVQGVLVQGSMTCYIPQMLQPDWSK